MCLKTNEIRAIRDYDSRLRFNLPIVLENIQTRNRAKRRSIVLAYTWKRLTFGKKSVHDSANAQFDSTKAIKSTTIFNKSFAQGLQANCFSMDL
jgi:hypothetical protein